MDTSQPTPESQKDLVPGGLAKGMSINDIAKKHNIDVNTLVEEFKKGITVEMEHTTDTNIAKEITLDHLFEDPQYYTKLSSVESPSNDETTTNESQSSVYADWDEYANPFYILVKLKNGKTLKISKGKKPGSAKVYQALLQAFNTNRYDITDKIVAKMSQNLGQGDAVAESVNEASVGSLQKQFARVLDDIEYNIREFKKVKGSELANKFIQTLKDLNAKKKELERELDNTVAGLYKNAELKITEATINFIVNNTKADIVNIKEGIYALTESTSDVASLRNSGSDSTKDSNIRMTLMRKIQGKTAWYRLEKDDWFRRYLDHAGYGIMIRKFKVTGRSPDYSFLGNGVPAYKVMVTYLPNGEEDEISNYVTDSGYMFFGTNKDGARAILADITPKDVESYINSNIHKYNP